MTFTGQHTVQPQLYALYSNDNSFFFNPTTLSLSPPCTSQVIFSAHWIFIQQVAGESVTDL